MTTLPYGAWPSPLSAADLFTGLRQPSSLVADGDTLLWIESRPDEGGRQALVRWDGDGITEVSPGDWNVRTRVHEYGGVPFVARDGVVLASRWTDQRLYRLGAGTPPTPVSEEPPTPGAIRYADGDWSPDGAQVLFVREDHRGDGEPRNEVVALSPVDGVARPLVTGRDFVAFPRWSPDGTRIAWLAWDHPHMPWDAAELWTATVTDDGLRNAGHVAGGNAADGGRAGSAAGDVCWLPDGSLVFTDDTSGFWEVHLRTPDGRVRRVSEFGAEVGFPLWRLGIHAMAPLDDGRVACVVVDDAVQRVHVLDLRSGAHEPLDLPFVVIGGIASFRDGLALLGTGAGGDRVVATWSPAAGLAEISRVALEGLRPGDRGAIEAVSVDAPDGGVVHAFVHPPACEGMTGPPDERPPLLVVIHGGPTGAATPVTSRAIAYWTTRGLAVADVNYRGSAGYGRAYREALRGRWGELDVADVIIVARELAARGVVDGDRMAVRGGSAGGFTTLAALTTPDHPFACGTSFFGVADLRALAEHTHKFESRYLDGLVGPLPEAADTYRERSPLFRTDRLSVPLLVLQGLEDEVVPPAQAEAIVAAAADAGVPHAYLAFEDEQHGFRRREHLIAWHEAELSFYGQVMGFAPADDIAPLELDTGPVGEASGDVDRDPPATADV